MTVVIAHRGASKDHEENTISAFQGALKQGADWVEFDVRRTSDHELVIHHDAALKDGRFVNETRLDELPKSVPRLKTALEACAGMGVNVEIKNLPGDPGHDPTPLLARQVAQTLAEGSFPNGVLVTCFDLITLGQFRDTSPEVDLGYLVISGSEPLDAVAEALKLGCKAINPYGDFVDQALIERAHAAGIEVNAWTVDDPERIAELAGLGIDGIITNVPAIARASL